jgi:hypothetical protein
MSNKAFLKVGEAKTLTLSVTDADGAAVDLSLATLLLGVKQAKSDTVYAFSKIDGDFDKSNAVNGVISVHLTAENTNQPENTYIGELKCSWTGPPAVVEKSADFYIQIRLAVTL